MIRLSRTPRAINRYEFNAIKRVRHQAKSGNWPSQINQMTQQAVSE